MRSHLAMGMAAGLTMTAMTVLPAAPAALAAPAAHAEVQRPDHVTVTAVGGPAYRLEGDLTGGGIVVNDAPGDFGTSKIQGQGSLPGGATVNFKITRAAFGALSGTFTLQDPAADVQVSATVSGDVKAPSDDTVTWQGTGTVRRGSQSADQNVSFTVVDRRPDPGDHAIHLTHAGQNRTAILRLPDNYDGSPRPVLFHFPGLLEDPWSAEFYGRMADYAAGKGFIMMTPAHYGVAWQGGLGGGTSPDVDDPGFINRLQDILIERFNADPARLYASGMSNGGYFTSKMACENKRFAAYAPVAGQLGGLNGIPACNPGRAIPIVVIHGDGDPLVPYSTATAAADFWARNNGCAATKTTTDLPNTHPEDNTTVTRHTYDGCPANAPVVLYQIKGGGHNWPGGIPFLGPFLGGTTYDIDGNTVIWEFVSRFRLG